MNGIGGRRERKLDSVKVANVLFALIVVTATLAIVSGYLLWRSFT